MVGIKLRFTKMLLIKKATSETIAIIRMIIIKEFEKSSKLTVLEYSYANTSKDICTI